MIYASSAFTRAALAGALALVLAGCQAEKGNQSSPDLALKSSTSPSEMVVSLARTAQTCWFKSKDPVFAKYRLASEVNSYAGRPRFLLVPKNNPGGLPELVVQAERAGTAASGKYTNVQTFGPLLRSGNGKRISDDVKRWAKGDKSCTAKA